MEISFNWVVPVLRIFDIDKADEFYQGFLGFSVDWDHRFDPADPLYHQISRGDLILHLSEHPSDGSPGARIRVTMRGIDAFQREISAKGYEYMRPGLETMPWGTLDTGVIDPFGRCRSPTCGGRASPLYQGSYYCQYGNTSICNEQV